MQNIMFICTGNTCRSAMAEAIMQKKLRDTKNDDKYKAFSAGIYAYDGERSTYEAIKVLKDNFDIDLSNHMATGVRNSKIEDMDLILCMTAAHKNILSLIYPNLLDRIFLFKQYIGLEGDIEDPYGLGIEEYIKCALELDECIERLLKKEVA